MKTPHVKATLALLLPTAFPLAACAEQDATQETGASGWRAPLGPGYVVEDGIVQPVNGLPNPYETIRNWGAIPEGRVWGSVSGLETDVDGAHIWVADRCGANSCAGSTVDPILKLDPDGSVVASFGAGTVMWPHGIHVDDGGNVWITDARGARPDELERFPDAAALGHRVIKFSPQGEVLLTIGVGGEPGDPPTHLTEPNDVITSPNGDIFVAEGHSGQNTDDPDTPSRINKYSADGTFIMSWGTWGSEPGQFKTPHALAWDSQGRLFVSDRGNNRIQIFDQDGTFIDEWYQFSRISGLHIDSEDVLYAIDSESGSARRNPGWMKGLRIGSARTGDVWYYVPHHDSEIPSGGGGFGAMGEGVTVDAAGNVYGGEVGSITGLTKFIPRLLP